MAEPSVRSQLAELIGSADLNAADIDRWRSLIAATGAVAKIEEMIADRLRRASEWIDAEPTRPGGAIRAARHGVGVHAPGGVMRTISGRSDHVVVVGAGLAGLAAALHLAGRGRAGHRRRAR